jgi:glycosyltransferase involved in cell wall biosynthesis
MTDLKQVDVAFIGSAGVPNRYGGFEAFLECCGPQISRKVRSVHVTCDASLYENKAPVYNGISRIFIGVRANGVASVLHDMVAFFRVLPRASHIVVLGVSAGVWFPLFRSLCSLSGKRLLVNVDGVEWRRDKFSVGKRLVLRVFDWLAQRCAHVVIYDNTGLKSYVLAEVRAKAVEIAYSGDHVIRRRDITQEANTALTICRIEPENQLELLIQGVLASSLQKYTIVGNWNNSKFGRILRAKYQKESRLQLLDPIYDPEQLCVLRESCEFYLHGHSVGGTNPSLVEMLFYDCHIICFDVSYNRSTAGSAASYVSDADSLSKSIDAAIGGVKEFDHSERYRLRSKYTSRAIADAYLAALDC